MTAAVAMPMEHIDQGIMTDQGILFAKCWKGWMITTLVALVIYTLQKYSLVGNNVLRVQRT